MARCARKKSASGIYHIMMRGINRQDIFFDDEDYSHFLRTMKHIKENGSCALYGYCLMDNHIHLLLHEKAETVSVTMQRIGTSYAWWYNKKYDRVGHVFQNRFQSEAVETEAYLLGALRYIHNNPVEANISSIPEEYNWSSCQAYYKGQDFFGLTDFSFILDSLHSNREAAIKAFADFMKKDSTDQFMDFEVKVRKSDHDLMREIQNLLHGQPVETLQNLKMDQRNEIIRRVKVLEGVTQRQIARVTGVHQSIIFKI